MIMKLSPIRVRFHARHAGQIPRRKPRRRPPYGDQPRYGTIEHRIFKDIIDYFEESIFVFNDTKVFPGAPLRQQREKTRAPRSRYSCCASSTASCACGDVLVDPARKIRIGNKLYFGDDDDMMGAEVIDNTTSRGRTLRFLFDGSYEEFKAALYRLGETPLPRWVREKVEPGGCRALPDHIRPPRGRRGAPTAGMHFEAPAQAHGDQGSTRPS